jgi:hypothetical protein
LPITAVEGHYQPAHPGVIGQQHGLQRLTETLAILSKGQTQQETRDTAIRDQLTSQAQTLANLQTWHQRLVLAIGGLGLVVLTLSAMVGWQMMHPPEQAYAKALGAVDSVLVQQWGSLAKTTQEHLTTTYNRLGLLPPGQRK